MVRWSFGLRQLFLGMSAIALGLVALRSASVTWVAVLLGLIVTVLASSILLAIYRLGPQRAYWVGFAMFGWLYMLVLVASWTIAQSAPSPLRADNLPTQRLASRSYHWLYDREFEKYYGSRQLGDYYHPMPGEEYVGSGLGTGGSLNGPVPPPGPNETDFVNVAHALWTLLFAAMGGCLAYWLHVTGPGQTKEPASGSS